MTIITRDELPDDDSLHKVEEATIIINGKAQEIDIWEATFMGRKITHLVEHVEDKKISKQIKRSLDVIQHDGETLKKRRVVATPPATINDLPIEVLQMIFLQATVGSNSKGLIATLRQTCQRFNGAADDSILGIYLKERNLSFKDIGLTTKDAAFEFATKMGKNLKIADFTQFSLTNDDIEKLSVSCPSIQNLSLNGSNEITGEGLRYLNNMESLESLNLSNCFLSERIDSELLKSLTSIKALDLSTCKVSSETLKDLSEMKQLHTLMLEDIGIEEGDKSNKFMSEISKLTGLKKLDLSGNDNLANHFNPYLESLTQLEELWLLVGESVNLSFCENLTSLKRLAIVLHQTSDLAYLLRMPNLEELILERYDVSISKIKKIGRFRLIPSSIKKLHITIDDPQDEINNYLSPINDIFEEFENLQEIIIDMLPKSFKFVRTDRSHIVDYKSPIDPYNRRNLCL